VLGAVAGFNPLIGALVGRALVGGMPEREARRTLERLRANLEQFTELG